MTDLDPAITAQIDVDGVDRNDTATVKISMTRLQVGVLRDYLDGVDISDIALNPGSHGMDDDEAQDYAAVLGQLRAVLSKAYPY